MKRTSYYMKLLYTTVKSSNILLNIIFPLWNSSCNVWLAQCLKGMLPSASVCVGFCSSQVTIQYFFQQFYTYWTELSLWRISQRIPSSCRVTCRYRKSYSPRDMYEGL